METWDEKRLERRLADQRARHRTRARRRVEILWAAWERAVGRGQVPRSFDPEGALPPGVRLQEEPEGYVRFHVYAPPRPDSAYQPLTAGRGIWWPLHFQEDRPLFPAWFRWESPK